MVRLDTRIKARRLSLSRFNGTLIAIRTSVHSAKAGMLAIGPRHQATGEAQ